MYIVGYETQIFFLSSKYIFITTGAGVFHISTAACVSDIFSEDCIFTDLISLIFLESSVDSDIK